ncbi:MAG: TrkH family potassium uptake protein, partial [Selenomonas artemidis]
TVACLTTTGSVSSLAGLDTLAGLPAWTKFSCAFLMVLGRIEVFAFFLFVGALFENMQRKW